MSSRKRAASRSGSSVLPRVVAVSLLVGALGLALLGAVTVARGGDSPKARPSRPRVAVVDIRVPAAARHQAETSVRYRIRGDAGKVAVRLVLTDGSRVVKRLRLGRRAAGAWHRCRLRLSFPPGRYVCTVQAGSAQGSARLRVLAPVPRLEPAVAVIERAMAYIRTRSCDAALAIVDTRGRLHAYRGDAPFRSGSVVKAMLLVQYLRTHDEVSDQARSLLAAMITRSDNRAAFAIAEQVGVSGLKALARRAGMRRFETGSYLLESTITAADQARFFWSMDRYIPPSHRALAHELLIHICSGQSWGLPESLGRRDWRISFKGGWLDGATTANELVAQVARLERGRLKWSVAVLTDGNPTATYGLETLRGVGAALAGD